MLNVLQRTGMMLWLCSALFLLLLSGLGNAQPPNSNLILHFDPTNVVDVLRNVTTWTDTSVNGNHATSMADGTAG